MPLVLVAISKQHASFLAGAPLASLAANSRQFAHHAVTPNVEAIWICFTFFHSRHIQAMRKNQTAIDTIPIPNTKGKLDFLVAPGLDTTEAPFGSG